MKTVLAITVVTLFAQGLMAAPGRVVESAAKKSTAVATKEVVNVQREVVKLNEVVRNPELLVLAEKGEVSAKAIEGYSKMMKDSSLRTTAETVLAEIGRESDLLTSGKSAKRAAAFKTYRRMVTEVLPELIAEGSKDAEQLLTLIAKDLKKDGGAVALWNANSKHYGITINSKDNAEVTARKTSEAEKKLKEQDLCVI